MVAWLGIVRQSEPPSRFESRIEMCSVSGITSIPRSRRAATTRDLSATTGNFGIRQQSWSPQRRPQAKVNRREAPRAQMSRCGTESPISHRQGPPHRCRPRRPRRSECFSTMILIARSITFTARDNSRRAPALPPAIRTPPRASGLPGPLLSGRRRPPARRASAPRGAFRG